MKRGFKHRWTTFVKCVIIVYGWGVDDANVGHRPGAYVSPWRGHLARESGVRNAGETPAPRLAQAPLLRIGVDLVDQCDLGVAFGGFLADKAGYRVLRRSDREGGLIGNSLAARSRK